jgi:hypothetical protein
MDQRPQSCSDIFRTSLDSPNRPIRVVLGRRRGFHTDASQEVVTAQAAQRRRQNCHCRDKYTLRRDCPTRRVTSWSSRALCWLTILLAADRMAVVP